MSLAPKSDAACILAVLGPTNTGKTHLAVERMLDHRDGVIGLPLRLLAREIYDRVAAARGPTRVALITGEEKIVPPRPSYFVCTVEAMPLDRDVDFVAVDEIQLCADAERGHVFTDRLLKARGKRETMFLGADTIKPLIRRLVPEAEHIARPRFSTLRYAGARKISRLPRRSAVVAFSAADVYALAELVRRQRGGTAVVLGALSPRTRNAQVAMYQAGEVDYLVATDAIGMGLNMDVDHVAFAALRKFDGRVHRELSAAELGQIAGRAGRHMSDGSFGVTAEVPPLEEPLVERLENHRFEKLKAVFWRNGELDLSSVPALLASLEKPPALDGLMRVREADDHLALRRLAERPEIAERARGKAAVRLLWEVCSIPDFRKTMPEVHARLLGQIYLHLAGPEGGLPNDWLAARVARLDRSDGDIDTLATRIAHVRTWTYVSHHAEWLKDARHWQERTREIEDRLSDALHERLTQRFVDRRTAALARGLREKEKLLAMVDKDGGVVVEGQFVGRLKGFAFAADAGVRSAAGRTARAAVRKALDAEIAARARRFQDLPDSAIGLARDGRLLWEGTAVGRLVGADDVLAPRIELAGDELLAGARAGAVRRRLEEWLERHVSRILAPLFRLREDGLDGLARGLAFQLGEGLGSLPRRPVEGQLKALSTGERRALVRRGVRIGALDLYLPALLRREAIALRAILWAVHRGLAEVPAPPSRPSVATDPALPGPLYRAMGYRVLGKQAVRLDTVERLARAARRLAQGGPFQATHELQSLIGGEAGDLAAALSALGYRGREEADGGTLVFTPRPPGRKPAAARVKRGRRPRPPRTDPDSPFAALEHLKVRAR